MTTELTTGTGTGAGPTGLAHPALPVLARQEIRHYAVHKLFWFGAALTVALDVVMAFDLDHSTGSTGAYMIGPAAMLGVLGMAVMYGLTRRSDLAAESAGAVAVPERTRTLALAAATVVPLAVALPSWLVAVVGYHVHPPASDTIPAGVSAGFVHAMQFGGGVLCALGGPLLGLLLARYVPRRGVVALTAVGLVLVTILLQGGLFGHGQPFRVLWFWTYFVTQVRGADGAWHMGSLPGNPYPWVGYLLALCALGVVLSVAHDPDGDRALLRRVALAVLAAAAVFAVLTLTTGPATVVNPAVCSSC